MTKPRLREKGGGEVAIPAYDAMQENGMSERMLDVLMRRISTRQYADVLPEMASTCGVKNSGGLPYYDLSTDICIIRPWRSLRSKTVLPGNACELRFFNNNPSTEDPSFADVRHSALQSKQRAQASKPEHS